ncbi:DUF21 domain-containing protein [Psychromonas antarctica]|jgi:metal transporter CNNM|uniref:DUF21 domain-containing protein n=1 Tax=Psychromonas antarctica TaxID=67573 RepID=UPI001EE90F45|nr:DUF21 domain-containing protein [Psychromonas antarctica]MCG6199716.1 DUF21 domain-containing protein [Psychromonas antarctica]
MTLDLLIWLGIIFCITQSAIFSGLNLAFFSISRLQLEVEAKRGSKEAQVILNMREDSNFLLSTILWGNVSINVLLTLLSDSVLAGVYSFLFSTVAITFLGEIFPQAYFSRNALKVASRLTPVIRIYQVLLFPVAKLSALILDGWLGREGITYFREKELKAIITAHIDADEAEVQHVEGIGAINFLQIDDIPITSEGEELDPQSLIQLPCKLDLPIIPERGSEPFKQFIQDVNASGHKWVILANALQQPLLVIDADGFIRSVLTDELNTDPYQYCHRPLIIHHANCTLGQAMQKLKEAQGTAVETDEVLDHDVILVWTDMPRIITGADILGRLLKGIGKNQESK